MVDIIKYAGIYAPNITYFKPHEICMIIVNLSKEITETTNHINIS